MDARFSFEKRVIQLVVIGGVFLLSLVYIFSVEWLPTLRRKLQLQSEKYQYLKTLREKQEQQKQQVCTSYQTFFTVSIAIFDTEHINKEENDTGDEAKNEGASNPEEVESTNLSNKKKKLLLRNLPNSQNAHEDNINSSSTNSTPNDNQDKKTSDTQQENHAKKERLGRVPLKKTSRDMIRHRRQSENTHVRFCCYSNLEFV